MCAYKEHLFLLKLNQRASTFIIHLAVSRTVNCWSSLKDCSSIKRLNASRKPLNYSIKNIENLPWGVMHGTFYIIYRYTYIHKTTPRQSSLWERYFGTNDVSTCKCIENSRSKLSCRLGRQEKCTYYLQHKFSLSFYNCCCYTFR